MIRNLTGTITTNNNLTGYLTTNLQYSTSFHYPTGYNEYTGEYTFTPNFNRQVISTSDKHLNRDIVIKPIPKNYGLISYNGAVITVS